MIANRPPGWGEQASGVTRSIPDLAPMWWMRIIGVPANAPPTRPSFARNSSTIAVLKSSARRVGSFITVLLAGVFVVAANPRLEPIALVASVRYPVEDRVVVHEE